MKTTITATLLASFFLLSQPAAFGFQPPSPAFEMENSIRILYSELRTPNSEQKIAQSELRPLIASEEEVKKFLDTYIDRYTRKDVDGLIFLFSPRAVQNRQQRLEEIQTDYASFCDRSEEIRYRLEDVKTEIYENGAEIKARYELNQLPQKGEKRVWKGQIRWLLIKEDGTLKILFLDYQNQ